MNGKLGALFKGKRQVGGFLDWDEITLLNESSDRDGNKVNKFANWTLTAQSYWLFDEVPRPVTVRLYFERTGYWEGTGYIGSVTRKVYDTLIPEQIEIVGEGILEGRE
jgi:hypothetical protein